MLLLVSELYNLNRFELGYSLEWVIHDRVEFSRSKGPWTQKPPPPNPFGEPQPSFPVGNQPAPRAECLRRDDALTRLRWRPSPQPRFACPKAAQR